MSLIENDDGIFETLRKQIGKEIIDRHEAVRNELTFLRKSRTDLQDKLDRLLLRMAEDYGEEDLQDFKKMRDKLKPDLAEVEAQIRELEGQDDSSVETGLETLETTQEFVNIFKIKDLSSGTLETDKELPSKRILLKAVIRTIICGEPIPKLGEKYTPLAGTFDGVEPFYNEPLSDLWEIKMSRELIRIDREFGPKPSFPSFLAQKGKVAGPTRLELATSDVTGQRSNQLNYGPAQGDKIIAGKGPFFNSAKNPPRPP